MARARTLPFTPIRRPRSCQPRRALRAQILQVPRPFAHFSLLCDRLAIHAKAVRCKTHCRGL
jgi:hypothetical protein